jgi:hypothetical protein
MNTAAELIQQTIAEMDLDEIDALAALGVVINTLFNNPRLKGKMSSWIENLRANGE